MFFNRPDSTQPSNTIPPSQMGKAALSIQVTALLFSFGIFASGCVIHDNGRGRGHYTGGLALQPNVSVSVPAPLTFSFTDHHRHRVRDYYHHHPRHHGKKHKWKKKWKRKGHRHGYHRHDVFRPGIQLQVLPVDLVRELPRTPRGTQYVYHDDQVLLLDLNTRVVLDTIDIVVDY